MKKLFPFLFILLLTFVFFWQFFLKGLLPIPADTIIGLYHPFRDLYAKDYPNGIPFKNFLITDPVRQQFPWKKLAISTEKQFELPLWNPYNFSGTPLLANFQSASFYPLNILFFLMPFVTGWSLLIFLAPTLAGIFLYLYLDNLRLNKLASMLGAVVFAFSGFSIAWLEWGNILHTAIWLPLILLAVDKIFLHFRKKANTKYQISKIWSLIFIFSLLSSFFAGHLQIFSYVFLISITYIFVRWMQLGRLSKFLYLFLILYILFFLLTLIQWLPTLQFILLSAREIDQATWQNSGWLIPWKNLIQFVAPDYFGNPATGNYWGAWNYGELVGYMGVIPLVLALFAMFFRRDRKTFFFGTILFLSLIFSLPTFFAKIPYLLKIPFLSTAQPTRLLMLIDFSLAVLSAFGLDYLIKTKDKKFIFSPLVFIAAVLTCLWIFILPSHAQIAKNNLILPTLLFATALILFIFLTIFKKTKRITLIIFIIIITVTVFDLIRFGWKFTPFTNKDYLYPQTRALSYLKKNLGDFRFMTTDARILPPNFSSIYRLQSVDGYDPLYLQRYGELIVASERKKADTTHPFGFNRIINPHNYESKIIDLLGVKYILSLSEINSPKLKKVFKEGQTTIYENADVVPRAFFVEKIGRPQNKEEAIRMMFDNSFNPKTTAVIEDTDEKINVIKYIAKGEAEITEYSENKVVIKTQNAKDGFLILTDTFYPTWKVKIDGEEAKIYRTDYNFRGTFVFAGRHTVEYYATLF